MHQLLMGQILKDIYSDTAIASLLGFKGGTCAYFLYNLPRFSVDLDFDLLETGVKTQKLVLEKMAVILTKYGKIIEKANKNNTLFFLLSYGAEDRNIKVEISTRKLKYVVREKFEFNDYLGISLLTAKKDYLFAGKLLALTLRGELAMRDVFDIDYFSKNNWEIDEEVITAWVDKPVAQHLADCLARIEKINEKNVLSGLGEMLNEKQKAWAKKELKKDVVFQLKNYLSVLERKK